MSKDNVVDKILEGFFQNAARKQHFGEPHDPSPTCKVCHGTGWDKSESR
jgi:hypothetical protein